MPLFSFLYSLTFTSIYDIINYKRKRKGKTMRELNELEIQKIKEMYERITAQHDLYADENCSCVSHFDDDDWSFQAGASKLVAIPEFADDFVVKIPFYGYSGEERDDDCYCQCKADYIWDVAIGEEKPDPWGDGICDMCDDYKVKTYTCPFEGMPLDAGNYCEAEYLAYQKAKELGVESVLAEVYPLSLGVDDEVWIQQKVEKLGLYFQVSPEQEKSLRDALGDKYITSPFSDSIAISIIENEGLDFFNKFQDFIKDNELNDFHSANYGTNNGRLMFLDYSGYST